MLLLKLSPSQIEMFTGKAEAGMGFQFARLREAIGFILSGRVLTFSDAEDDGPYSADLANRLWFGPEARYRFDTRRPVHRNRRGGRAAD